METRLYRGSGYSAIILLPAHSDVLYDQVVDGLEVYRPPLREAYAALCGIYDDSFYLEKLSPDDGAPAYCLHSTKMDYLLGHPDATKMLLDTIKHLLGCTLCGSTSIASGGALDVDVDGRIAGGLYALCPSCRTRTDRIQRIRAALGGRDIRLPQAAGPGMLQ